jgi:heat shock protein HslJ
MNLTSVLSATILLIILIVLAFFVLPPSGEDNALPSIADVPQSAMPVAEDAPEAEQAAPPMGDVEEALNAAPSRDASVMPDAPPADTPVTSEMAAQLGANRWMLAWLKGEDVTGGDRAPNIVFDVEQGRVSGYGGCNRYSGSADIGSGSIAFGPMVATQMGCDQLTLEGDYLGALESAAHWRITNGTLILSDAQDKDIARYTQP